MSCVVTLKSWSHQSWLMMTKNLVKPVKTRLDGWTNKVGRRVAYHAIKDQFGQLRSVDCSHFFFFSWLKNSYSRFQFWSNRLLFLFRFYSLVVLSSSTLTSQKNWFCAWQSSSPPSSLLKKKTIKMINIGRRGMLHMVNSQRGHTFLQFQSNVPCIYIDNYVWIWCDKRVK